MPFNLLSSAVEGAAYLILLFGLCFGAVVGVKLVNRKLRERDEKPEPGGAEPAEPSKPTRAAARTPRRSKKRSARTRAQKVYYILERAEEDRAEKEREKAKTK